LLAATRKKQPLLLPQLQPKLRLPSQLHLLLKWLQPLPHLKLHLLSNFLLSTKESLGSPFLLVKITNAIARNTTYPPRLIIRRLNIYISA
jgi:hypothetical protein